MVREMVRVNVGWEHEVPSHLQSLEDIPEAGDP